MIISLRLKNFYSLRDDTVIDFTADLSSRGAVAHLPENLIDFSGDKFVNIIGLFGSNAAGKSNIIKAFDFCRKLILNSHLYNEGDKFDYEPFKFDSDRPSEFYIDFVTGGVEYEYSFEIMGNRILTESLYYYPNKRKARIFERTDTFFYTHRKGVIQRPAEVEANTGEKTLFLSRASSMNRSVAQSVYRFFLNEIVIGSGYFNVSDISSDEFESNKDLLLKALEVSDSDIVDIRVVEDAPGNKSLRSFHRENPAIAFDFEKEESDGTKRLLSLLLLLLKTSRSKATVFLDEFDLKLHLRLAEFILDVVRASSGAQLVFTSHNPSLINRENLRDEQIVFVNKQPNGNSEFTPLSDFSNVGKKTDIQKAYLQGRFDAVPYIGNLYPELIDLLNRP
ncbi:MAG: ATP-binding protein [Duncaniella sp.]|nr:ATP-binding protein [Duncaniella sp.]